MRVFVAIDLPPQLREALASLIEGMREESDGVRWARPGGIHLTLRFIGEVSEDGLAPLREQLGRSIPHATAPFEVTARGIGTFPERGRPRVLWVALEEESGALPSLQAAVEAAVVQESPSLVGCCQ